jgi:hypothetical protein
MTTEYDKFHGIVNEIGLERDEEQFANFNLKVGILVKTDKKLTYKEGERIIKKLRKDLLGKNIELEPIAIPCPVCGKIFNTEIGAKQHLRRMHKNKILPDKKKSLKNPSNKKTKNKNKRSTVKRSSKKK